MKYLAHILLILGFCFIRKSDCFLFQVPKLPQCSQSSISRSLCWHNDDHHFLPTTLCCNNKRVFSSIFADKKERHIFLSRQTKFFNHKKNYELEFDEFNESEESSKNDRNNKNKNYSKISLQKWRQTFAASFWIAGCTVGGGFLALPSLLVTEGIKIQYFIITMIFVWLYFWAQSIILLDSLSTQNSITGLAQDTLGTGGRMFTTILLLLVVEATLISQISRAGTLITAIPYKLTCTIVSTLLAIPIFILDDTAPAPSQEQSDSGRKNLNDRINSILVSCMIIFAMITFFQGQNKVPWSQLLSLKTSSGIYSAFFSSEQIKRSTFLNWIHMLPSTLPTLLQLMVYGEILPIVSPLLSSSTGSKSDSSMVNEGVHNDGDILRRNFAIAFGSFLPLVLLVGWSTLGIALTVTSTNTVGRTTFDPVQTLVFNKASPIRIPLLGLAWSAISTTILSSYLALKTIWTDIFVGTTSKMRKRNTMRRNKWLMALSIVVPACAIASISPDIFLRAIDFAGSYPVLWLWGVLPPIMSLRLSSSQDTNKVPNKRALLRVWSLFIISLGMVAMSIIPDIRWLLLTLETMKS